MMIFRSCCRIHFIQKTATSFSSNKKLTSNVNYMGSIKQCCMIGRLDHNSFINSYDIIIVSDITNFIFGIEICESTLVQSSASCSIVRRDLGWGLLSALPIQLREGIVLSWYSSRSFFLILLLNQLRSSCISVESTMTVVLFLPLLPQREFNILKVILTNCSSENLLRNLYIWFSDGISRTLAKFFSFFLPFSSLTTYAILVTNWRRS